MKTKTFSIVALALLPAALFTLISCSSTSQPPPAVGSSLMTYKKGVPGEVITQTVKVTATVTAIDHDRRKATLLGQDGNTFEVLVGRKALNFDQVRVGDQIAATLTQRVAVSLEDDAAPSAGGAAAVLARAPKGDQRGGVAVQTIQATGKIVAVDLESRKVTVQFEDGDTQTFPARSDTDLTRLKLGQREVLRVTEMVLIRVEKPQ